MPSLVDCFERSNLPRCGRVRQVINKNVRDIEVQAYIPETNSWNTVFPLVKANTQISMPNGAVWLPKNCIIRSVDATDKTELQVHGAVGDGLDVIAS